MEPIPSTSQANSDSLPSSQPKRAKSLIAIDYEMIAGKQSSSKLLWASAEKQLYRFNTKSKIGRSYECYQNSCKVRVYLQSDFFCYKADDAMEHLHGDQKSLYDQFCVINEIKTKVLQNKTTPLRAIYNEVIAR